jgi:hypothetical protein
MSKSSTSSGCGGGGGGGGGGGVGEDNLTREEHTLALIARSNHKKAVRFTNMYLDDELTS